MNLVDILGPHLPFLRRYARALTGDQKTGDHYVRLALEAVVAGDMALNSELAPRVALYHVFQSLWGATGAQVEARSADRADSSDAAAVHLMRITPRSRQAFLLTAVEGFSIKDTAQILGLTAPEVQVLIALAQGEIDAELATQVLIIEDEGIIAADLEALVAELGHTVSGVAATRAEAVKSVAINRPGLVLADIQLADGSSGIDAVADILKTLDVPVIFITAFPERLLTGEGLEPTYLITKPFLPATVRAAIGQALFFHPRSLHSEAG